MRRKNNIGINNKNNFNYRRTGAIVPFSSRNPLYFWSWPNDNRSNIKRRRSLTSRMTLYYGKSVSHLPISCFNNFLQRRVNVLEKKDRIRTSRRYGVTADTKRRRDACRYQTQFSTRAHTPPRYPGGRLKRRGATRGDNAKGIPYSRTGNRRDSSFARRS